MPNRRNFLKTAAGMLTTLSGGTLLPSIIKAREILQEPDTLPSGTLESDILASIPGKQNLIKKTYRPLNYETPVADFNTPFTPNERFFVRYHLASIPEISLSQWKLQVGGDAVNKPLAFTLDELRRNFEMVELPALCMCAGNRRGLFEPHVPGVQWGNGAMGNALWKGVRLRDVLKKAGLHKDALEVTFNGADTGVLEKTPDFVKSLPLSKALDEHTLIAFEMNGTSLPHWNGFPARLVVPGWAATYWVKHLTLVNVLAKPFDGFWVKNAYRIPTGTFAGDDNFPSQKTNTNTPITELVVNSFITHPFNGQPFKQSHPIEVKGVAWDGGHGIERVELSADGGKTWHPGQLGENYGPYAWRLWNYRFKPADKGPVSLMVRATNRIGQVQPFSPIPNPAGYHHNAVQNISIRVV